MIPDYLLSSYDYELPSEAIAQSPVVPRDNSRLLVIDSRTTHRHCIFHNLPEWLRPNDLLVLNNTRVIPARLYGKKSTGAALEILLLEEQAPLCWLALVKPGKRFKVGAEIYFDVPENLGENDEISLKAAVIGIDESTGGRILKFTHSSNKSFFDLIEQLGQIPLPPYITTNQSLPEQYQTIYAQKPGAVAAPTAGLHFTEELFQRLEEQGIKRATITLHVGLGTFRPVESEDITNHEIHQEWLEVSQETVDQIQEAKAKGGRIIAVGTTSVRALETIAQNDQLAPFCGKTDLYIYPGYQWKLVDGLITNFHLPRSSLLMLVSALIGRERLLSLYQEAIAENYRFYSFGDAMLILPEAVIN